MDVTVDDARDWLDALLGEVARGEDAGLLRGGVAVARLVPALVFDPERSRRAVAGLIVAAKFPDFGDLGLMDLMAGRHP